MKFKENLLVAGIIITTIGFAGCGESVSESVTVDNDSDDELSVSLSVEGYSFEDDCYGFKTVKVAPHSKSKVTVKEKCARNASYRTYVSLTTETGSIDLSTATIEWFEWDGWERVEPLKRGELISGLIDGKKFEGIPKLWQYNSHKTNLTKQNPDERRQEELKNPLRYTTVSDLTILLAEQYPDDTVLDVHFPKSHFLRAPKGVVYREQQDSYIFSVKIKNFKIRKLDTGFALNGSGKTPTIYCDNERCELKD